MSFSSDIKDGLCKKSTDCMSCRLSELRGALYFGGALSEEGVKFATENKNVAERVAADLAEGFGIYVRPDSTGKVQRINIEDIYQVENITGGISVREDMPFNCCRASFVRGAFLGGGYVTDPRKGYHMEFDTKSETAANMLCSVLESAGFTPKITWRKGYHVVYIKDSSEIADILGYMGAPSFAFELFEVQMEREMRNDVNRRVNCENANTNKAARASSKHLFAIKKIRKAGKLDKLPEVLKEIAYLREEYPEDSLKELGEKTNPPIGKSGVNHRLSRILEFADSI